ncbi:probable glycosyltransferase At5g20260 isoform X2 [Macadamia integrifolia]|uniref:probable glycosyltransferase At5g20260 isoform X2 n=1 Tax=Macadamia integrifolia TaxID=60698 RepID=UPI001C4EE255|nr:probable glycosyltransferase At5g20260 isoform X2 [Macadamia integrifolia]
MAVLSCRTHFLVFPVLLLLLVLFLYISPFNHNSVTVFLSSSPFSYRRINKKAPEISSLLTPSPLNAPTPIPSPKASFKSTNISHSSSSSINSSGNSATDTHIRVKGSLEKIEESLARARAAIRKAIISRNYTSDKEELFIPRGSIYRNPYGFHQSYIEMEKRFKVWTYKEGEPPLVHNGPMNDIYATEGQFIDEMESGLSPFTAHHPDEAHAFFLPFSIASAVHLLYRPIVSYSRAPLQRFVIDYVGVVSNKYPYWNRSSGADHFMVSCHDWAPDINEANPELFRYFIRVICNANTSEGFRPRIDATLPEVKLHYGALGVSGQSQSPKKRSTLAFFAGGSHGYIREILLEHWKDKDQEIQVHEYLPKGQDYKKLMGQMKYLIGASLQCKFRSKRYQ